MLHSTLFPAQWFLPSLQSCRQKPCNLLFNQCFIQRYFQLSGFFPAYKAAGKSHAVYCSVNASFNVISSSVVSSQLTKLPAKAMQFIVQSMLHSTLFPARWFLPSLQSCRQKPCNLLFSQCFIQRYFQLSGFFPAYKAAGKSHAIYCSINASFNVISSSVVSSQLTKLPAKAMQFIVQSMLHSTLFTEQWLLPSLQSCWQKPCNLLFNQCFIQHYFQNSGFFPAYRATGKSHAIYCSMLHSTLFPEQWLTSKSHQLRTPSTMTDLFLNVNNLK